MSLGYQGASWRLSLGLPWPLTILKSSCPRKSTEVADGRDPPGPLSKEQSCFCSEGRLQRGSCGQPEESSSLPRSGKNMFPCQPKVSDSAFSSLASLSKVSVTFISDPLAYLWLPYISLGFPCSSVSKESACSAGDLGSIPGLGHPWGRKRQPTPVSLPGKSHGQRSLVGCSPWSRKESGMTDQLTLNI